MTIELPPLPDLPEQLTELLQQIPAGQVATCGGLAAALGNPVAARWVASFVMHHRHAADCPCHRVVRANGELGAYVAGTLEEKAARLRSEGVAVQGTTLEVARYQFSHFRTARPLEQLQHFQEQLAAHVSLRGVRRPPALIGGVDVSYPSAEEGVAAYALVELDRGELVWSTTVRRPIRFPYITSYLAFREVPILLELLESVRAAGRLAEVLLVDGSGLLHPRHAGIASHFGVVASVATIGVTKTHLFGQVDLKGMEPGEPRLIRDGHRTIGVALRPTGRSRRPIFVSPGHRVSLGLAETVVRRLLRGRRLPEPLYWADRLSRAEGRRASGGKPG